MLSHLWMCVSFFTTSYFVMEFLIILFYFIKLMLKIILSDFDAYVYLSILFLETSQFGIFFLNLYFRWDTQLLYNWITQHHFNWSFAHFIHSFLAFGMRISKYLILLCSNCTFFFIKIDLYNQHVLLHLIQLHLY